jgi:putative YphP/YqiW family bacilliredoxin
MYPQDMVTPMQAELTASGFQDLHSAEAVENAMKAEGNASCSELCMWLRCKNARPGAKMSLEGAKKPDHLITVLQELIKML